MLAIIDSKISAVTFCELDALVSPRAGNDCGAEHLRDLHTGAAQGAGRASAG